jgi:transcriptional regulator with XRE-family HTH domain
VLLAPIQAPTANRFIAAAALIDDLPKLVAERREHDGLTVKSAAKAIGVTSTTLSRFETGSQPTKNTIQAVLHWLGS